MIKIFSILAVLNSLWRKPQTLNYRSIAAIFFDLRIALVLCLCCNGISNELSAGSLAAGSQGFNFYKMLNSKEMPSMYEGNPEPTVVETHLRQFTGLSKGHPRKLSIEYYKNRIRCTLYLGYPNRVVSVTGKTRKIALLKLKDRLEFDV